MLCNWDWVVAVDFEFVFTGCKDAVNIIPSVLKQAYAHVATVSSYLMKIDEHP